MPTIDRRTFLKLMGLSTTAGGAGLLSACNDKSTAPAASHAEAPAIADNFYDLPLKGNVRILHTTDFTASYNLFTSESLTSTWVLAVLAADRLIWSATNC